MTQPDGASVAAGRRSRWARLLGVARAVGLALIFGGSLYGTVVLFELWLPRVAVPLVDEKLAHFAAHKDEYDTLFFGSSRTYRHIQPAQFDAATAAAGRATKSFNFGIDGMFPPEDGFVAEQLFALGPRNLKRVFIEISFFRNLWIGMDPDSTRALYWHDGRRLAQLARETFTPYRPEQRINPPPPAKPRKFRAKDWRKNVGKTTARWRSDFQNWWRAMNQNQGGIAWRVSDFSTHLRLYVRQTFGVGRGALLVQRYAKSFRPGARKTSASTVPILGAAGDGGATMAHDKPMPPALLMEFERLRAERLANPGSLWPVSKAHGADLRGIVALVRAAGAEPILFISPEVIPCQRYLTSEPPLPLFNFTEVAKFPQLFRTENRVDLSHLDAAGAELFTAELARVFLEHEAGKAAR